MGTPEKKVFFKSNLIPPLSYPLSQWSKQTQQIFKVAGVDLDNAEHSRQLLPYLMARLPESTLAITPTTSLKETLTFLQEYDKPTTSWKTLNDDNQMAERPSYALEHAVKQVKEVMATGTPDDTLKQLAWLKLEAKLPSAIQDLLPVIAIDKYPNKEQLAILDTAWQRKETAKSTSTVNAVANAPSNDISTALERLNKRLDNLEVSMSNMAKNSHQHNNQRPVFQQNPNRFVPQHNQNQNATRPTTPHNHFRGTSNGGPHVIQNQPNTNSNLCWYHAKYGNRAFRCQAPCEFHRLN